MTLVTDDALRRFGATPGTVHLVGAGPGDPGLLTMRGASILASADVVLHDQLVTPEVIALAQISAEVMAVGRRCGDVVVAHEDVLAVMIERARRGERVVRLKGGDPMVFGRGAEEAAALLAAGVPVEVVSGITAAVGGPTAAGIPVTLRGVSRGFMTVTAHTVDGSDGVDWDVVARFDGTVVILMGRGSWGQLSSRLVAYGRSADEPAAAIAWASTPRQHVVVGTLATIAARAEAAGVTTPAILVIGDVVAHRDSSWAGAATWVRGAGDPSDDRPQVRRNVRGSC